MVIVLLSTAESLTMLMIFSKCILYRYSHCMILCMNMLCTFYIVAEEDVTPVA